MEFTLLGRNITLFDNGINFGIITIIAVVLMLIFSKKQFFVALGCVFIISFMLVFFLPLDTLKQAPFLKVEQAGTVKVPTDSAFAIESGQSSILNEVYAVSSGTSSEELVKWLSDKKKNVYIVVRNGADLIYSKNMGIVVGEEALDLTEEILSYYSTWQSTGTLPSENAVVRLGVFYMNK